MRKGKKDGSNGLWLNERKEDGALGSVERAWRAYQILINRFCSDPTRVFTTVWDVLYVDT